MKTTTITNVKELNKILGLNKNEKYSDRIIFYETNLEKFEDFAENEDFGYYYEDENGNYLCKVNSQYGAELVYQDENDKIIKI